MQNTNTNTTHTNTNAQFYATVDNDNLSIGDRLTAIKAIDDAQRLLPERFIGAVSVNPIVTTEARISGMMFRYERYPHEILAYVSRIVNPTQRQREVIFISRSPGDGSLWLSRDVESIDVVSRQYWLTPTLALRSYLELIGGAVTRRTLRSTQKLVEVTMASEVAPDLHLVVENDSSIRVVRSGSGVSTTWELITPNHGSRTLRTLNPAEGR